MEQSRTTNRVLLPRRSLQDATTTGSLHGTSQVKNKPEVANTSRRRRAKEASKTDEEWEAVREPFREHYVERGLRLEDAMQRLEESHRFRASRKQFNIMIRKWKLDKNVKRHEMKAIVRKRIRRQNEDPPKQFVFRVRGQDVSPVKIDRFERTNPMNQSADVEMFNRTPSVISCRTPSPAPSAGHKTVSVISSIMQERRAFLSLSPNQGSPNRRAISPQKSSQGALSPYSTLFDQFINLSPPVTPRSDRPNGKSMAANLLSCPISLSIALDESCMEPVFRIRSNASQSTVPIDHPCSSTRYSILQGLREFNDEWASTFDERLLEGQTQKLTESLGSRSPSLPSFDWWHSYGDWFIRHRFTHPDLNPVGQIVRSLIRENNSLGEERNYMANVRRISSILSKLQFPSKDCRNRQLLTMVEIFSNHAHSIGYGVDKSSHPYVEKEVWDSEISKTVISLADSEHNDMFRTLVVLAGTCGIVGLDHEVRISIRACIKVMKCRQPDTIETMFFTVILAARLTLSGDFDDAEDVLKCVLKGRLRRFKTADISAIPGMMFVEIMTLERGSLISTYGNDGRFSIRCILQGVARTLQALRKGQSGLALTIEEHGALEDIAQTVNQMAFFIGRELEKELTAEDLDTDSHVANVDEEEEDMVLGVNEYSTDVEASENNADQDQDQDADEDYVWVKEGDRTDWAFLNQRA